MSDQNVMTTLNQRGEWVPSIPEPFFYVMRFGCSCGAKFWTRAGCDGHYAYTHILGMRTRRTGR